MEELQIISNLENMEITRWDFDAIKSQLQKHLGQYKNIVYTDGSIKSAKEDRTVLNKAKKVVEDCRKAYKAKCMEPYEALEPQIKELVGMIESQRQLIDDTVKDYENRQKQKKEAEIKKYYEKKAFVLGELAEPLYAKLFEPKWLNASTSKGKYEEGVQSAINNALNDINAIRAMNTPFTDTLLEKYAETVSLEKVKEKNDELETSANKAGLTKFAEVINKADRKITANENPDEGIAVKIYATQRQMDQICDFMKAIGVTYEII